MKNFGIAIAAPLLLLACADTAISPNAAEQACLRDVTAKTNNPEAVVLGTEFSQAGALVTIGVGPNRAKWHCIAYADGTTAGIESLTDEGAL